MDIEVNVRLRQPLKSDYAEALGWAVYCFTILEWNVVWSCERIRPGSLRTILDDELTAGRIAKRFLDLSRNMPKSRERAEIEDAARQFAGLINLRNNIVHGKPCTGPNGDARLSHENVLEIADLHSAADAFSACSTKINGILHGFLKTYVPPSI